MACLEEDEVDANREVPATEAIVLVPAGVWPPRVTKVFGLLEREAN